MSVASERTALDVSRRNFDQPYWTEYDAHKVNCSNWDLAMGVNLSLRLVLANSALYDSRVCIKNRQRNPLKYRRPLSRAKAHVRRDVDARCK